MYTYTVCCTDTHAHTNNCHTVQYMHWRTIDYTHTRTFPQMKTGPPPWLSLANCMILQVSLFENVFFPRSISSRSRSWIPTVTITGGFLSGSVETRCMVKRQFFQECVCVSVNLNNKHEQQSQTLVAHFSNRNPLCVCVC